MVMSNILQGIPCLGQLANAPLQGLPCLKALKREWPSAQGTVGCHNAFRFSSWPECSREVLTSELRELLFPLVLHPPWGNKDSISPLIRDKAFAPLCDRSGQPVAGSREAL